MAAANPAQTVQDEMSCPICLEYLNDPVSLGCDHNFCRSCITQYWEGSHRVSCPQCKKIFPRRKLKPNRQLRTIVEAARGLRLQSEREAQTGVCEKHREPLKLFCKEDQIAICLVCDRSKEHRDHTGIPAEEAAEELKAKIQAHLKMLKEERETLLECKVSREKRSQDNLRKAQTERQKIVSEFQQLRQFLDKQERLLLAELEYLDEEMVTIQSENIAELSAEISRLGELISEMEEKCLKPASEFLQDVRSTLSRCGKRKFREPEVISPEIEKGFSCFSQKTVALMDILRTFKDTLPSALERKGQEPLGSLRGREFAATVTLDPDTAHPLLVLSEDQKCVKWGHTRQDLPNNPERFDTELWVLGHEGFTSGRLYWEVEVEDSPCWAVGVARASVRRKGEISCCPEGGIWAVERRWGMGQFQALTSPVTPLSQIRIPSRIRVCLDCDRGQVTFFNAGEEVSIFSFPLGFDPGERLRPWFWVGPGSQLQICP